MRVAIDVRPMQVESQYRGVGTYVRELLMQYLTRSREIILFAWPELPIGLDPQILSVCRVLETPKTSNMPWSKSFGYKRDGLDNKEFFVNLAQNADLIHFTDPQDIRFGFPWEDVGVPRVITVHDLMTITNADHIFHGINIVKRQVVKQLYKSYVEHYKDVNGIITVSQFTESVLRSVIKSGLPTVKAIWNGISDKYVLPYVAQVDEYRLQRKLPAKFILHVGTLLGNKNVEALLKATAPMCPWPFVFAGPYSEEEQNYLASKYPQQKIYWLGYVDKNELPMLYAAAYIFAFPSLMEGFGLPILDAMAVGTPVVCSNAASMPEVVGNAAVMFNPNNLTEIRNAIYGVMNNENMRMQMRTRGLERAQHLSWRRTAETTWIAYEAFVEEYQRNKRRKQMNMR